MDLIWTFHTIKQNQIQLSAAITVALVNCAYRFL